jgi:hypothetical protein
MPEPTEIVHSADELKQRLRQLGLAAAESTAIMEGFTGDYDTLVAFADTNAVPCAVGFLKSEVSADDASRIIGEVTILKPQPSRRIGPRTVTLYT